MNVWYKTNQYFYLFDQNAPWWRISDFARLSQIQWTAPNSTVSYDARQAIEDRSESDQKSLTQDEAIYRATATGLCNSTVLVRSNCSDIFKTGVVYVDSKTSTLTTLTGPVFAVVVIVCPYFKCTVGLLSIRVQSLIYYSEISLKIIISM